MDTRDCRSCSNWAGSYSSVRFLPLCQIRPCFIVGWFLCLLVFCSPFLCSFCTGHSVRCFLDLNGLNAKCNHQNPTTTSSLSWKLYESLEIRPFGSYNQSDMFCLLSKDRVIFNFKCGSLTLCNILGRYLSITFFLSVYANTCMYIWIKWNRCHTRLHENKF